MSVKPRRYVRGGDSKEASRLETQAKVMNPVLEKQFEIMGLKPHMKVLDAGCGTGANTRLFSSRVFPEEVVGLDMDPVFIEEARKQAESEGIENVRFDVGNIDDMNYDDGSFDLSYCNLVLMHVNDPVKSVSELKRVTKKGGSVAASEVDYDAFIFFPPLPKFEEILLKLIEYSKTIGINRYMGRELFSVFSQAGLSSIDVHVTAMCWTQRNPEYLKMTMYSFPHMLKTTKEEMINHGYITSEDFEEMLKEVDVWLNQPYCFWMGAMVFAVGKVTNS
jgi:ubiquinone/menaquinone biosynthesis C-methylase UbiE